MLRGWKDPFLDQGPPQRHAKIPIDGQDLHGHPADGRQARQFRALPGEVFGPVVAARIEERHNLLSRGIETRNVRSFMMVAETPSTMHVKLSGVDPNRNTR